MRCRHKDTSEEESKCPADTPNAYNATQEASFLQPKPSLRRTILQRLLCKGSSFQEKRGSQIKLPASTFAVIMFVFYDLMCFCSRLYDSGAMVLRTPTVMWLLEGMICRESDSVKGPVREQIL